MGIGNEGGGSLQNILNWGGGAGPQSRTNKYWKIVKWKMNLPWRQCRDWCCSQNEEDHRLFPCKLVRLKYQRLINYMRVTSVSNRISMDYTVAVQAHLRCWRKSPPSGPWANLREAPLDRECSSKCIAWSVYSIHDPACDNYNGRENVLSPQEAESVPQGNNTGEAQLTADTACPQGQDIIWISPRFANEFVQANERRRKYSGHFWDWFLCWLLLLQTWLVTTFLFVQFLFFTKKLDIETCCPY